MLILYDIYQSPRLINNVLTDLNCDAMGISMNLLYVCFLQSGAVWSGCHGFVTLLTLSLVSMSVSLHSCQHQVLSILCIDCYLKLNMLP